MQLAKQISVYISDKYAHIIIAPLHDKNGLTYEQEKCFVENYPINTMLLGAEVINNLNLFSFKDRDLRNLKNTDWPAFKHSKAKSVREFEVSYIPINIGSVNSSNLVLEIEGTPFKSKELSICSSISFNADRDELGQRVILVYQACITGKVF